MAKMIIVGDGETAELAYEYFTHDSPHEVAAFCVERTYKKKDSLFSLPVVAFEDVADLYPPSEFQAFVAISYTQLNRVRARLYLETRRKSFLLLNFVSLKAFFWHNVVLGDNCFIMENNVLQYSVKVGNNVVLWSGNHIGHQSIIHDHVFISSHVVVSGYCEVGENCFLGVNSTVADRVKIGRDCFIGAGSVIARDTEDGKVYKGARDAEPAAVGSLRFFRVKE